MVSPPSTASATERWGWGVGGMGSGKQVLCPNGPDQADSYFLGEGLPYNLGFLCCFVFSFPAVTGSSTHTALEKDVDHSRKPGVLGQQAGAGGWAVRVACN